MRLGRNKKIIGVTTLAVLCVGIAAALWLWTHLAVPTGDNAQIAYWKERIEAKGAEEAYTEFACSLKNKTGVQGHTEAHYFGTALYQEVGLAGAFTCDDRFQYGCLHELLGRALHAQGVSVLPALHAICAQSEATNQYSLCEHGIGHGILSYAGYNPQALTSALSLCKNSSAATAAGKCEAGVFMEYFDQTMLGADTPPFKISKDSPFAPCSGFAASEHAQCVSFMPRVWRKNFWPTSATSTEAVATTGAYCESLPEHFLQVSCFAGIGNELYIQTHGNTSAATLLCTHYSNDTSLVASCIKEIAHLANIDARAIHTDACTQ